jgi:predicted GNAT family acetyltransferase
VRAVLQEVLEGEMTEALAAAKGERVEGLLGYRSGYYPRSLITRIGKIELRVPQDRQGRFSTELFERYQRSEKALMAGLAEMYVQGIAGNLMTIFYTEVQLPLRGRGYGYHLVWGALQEVRHLNLKVEPECGFVREVINNRPEFKDMLV